MARYSGAIVDVDIHHLPKRDADLLEYLPQRWQEYARGNGFGTYPMKPLGGRPASLLDHGARRADSYPADGSPPGSDYELLRQQLLDRYDYYRGVTTWDVGEYAAHLNPYFASAVCRAANDWNIEQWLSRDTRLLSVAVVPGTDPQLAAQELRRVGSHRQIVGVLMSANPMGRPWGDPHYHPIYEAAADMDLVVSAHVNGTDRPRSIASVGGMLSNSIEYVSQLSQGAMNYVASFVVHGAFEKFPTLKVMIVEYGLAWIPRSCGVWIASTICSGSNHHGFRKLPSDYIRENMLFSTQPMEESPGNKMGLAQLLETVDGIDDMLCFSTDYPHDARRSGIRGQAPAKIMAPQSFFFGERLPCVRDPVTGGGGFEIGELIADYNLSMINGVVPAGH